ncbi:MAG: type VI secretion system tube protein Hcp [Oscillospiraceae bacterium]|nr:type VI secretion system tube protein Hcp [Oscillospiraceae bacterium]
MAFDAFLKVDGAPGESMDDMHKDWIEILSYHHGVLQPASTTTSSSGGATAERANFTSFSITKLVDKSSPKLFEASFTGRHIKEVVIEVCRSGGNKEKFMEIKMEQVLICSYDHDGGGRADFPVESVSFAPGKISMVYSQQKRSDGTLGGSVSTGWDLIANKIA